MQFVLAEPGIYLRELQEELYSCTMNWVDVSTICRTLHRIGLSYQKIRHYSLNQSEIKRAEFWAEMINFDPTMIVWVDETGCQVRNALRKYGYGVRGMPPQDFALILRGKRYSAIGILTTEGIEDVYILEESVNGGFFMFCKEVLATCLDAI